MGSTGREANPGKEWDFAYPSRTAPWLTEPPVQWVPGLFRGWNGQGVVLTTHPLLVARLQKGWSCTSTSPLCLHRYVLGLHVPLAWIRARRLAFHSVADRLFANHPVTRRWKTLGKEFLCQMQWRSRLSLRTTCWSPIIKWLWITLYKPRISKQGKSSWIHAERSYIFRFFDVVHSFQFLILLSYMHKHINTYGNKQNWIHSTYFGLLSPQCSPKRSLRYIRLTFPKMTRLSTSAQTSTPIT
jgi:hypothetical protein